MSQGADADYTSHQLVVNTRESPSQTPPSIEPHLITNSVMWLHLKNWMVSWQERKQNITKLELKKKLLNEISKSVDQVPFP